MARFWIVIASGFLLSVGMAASAGAQSDFPEDYPEPVTSAPEVPTADPVIEPPLTDPTLDPEAAAAASRALADHALAADDLEQAGRRLRAFLRHHGTLGEGVEDARTAPPSMMVFYDILRAQQYGIRQVGTPAGLGYVVEGHPDIFETLEAALEAGDALQDRTLEALGRAIDTLQARRPAEAAKPKVESVQQQGRWSAATNMDGRTIYLPVSPERTGQAPVPANDPALPAQDLGRGAGWHPDELDLSIPVSPSEVDRPAIPASRRTVPVDQLQREAVERQRVFITDFMQRANQRLRREILEAEMEVMERGRSPGALPLRDAEREMLERINEDRERRREADLEALRRDLRYLGPNGDERRRQDEAARRAAQEATARAQAAQAAQAEEARRAALTRDERRAEDFVRDYGPPRAIVLSDRDPNLPGVEWRVIVDPAEPNRLRIETRDRDYPNWLPADDITMDSMGAYSLLMRMWRVLLEHPHAPTPEQIDQMMADGGLTTANLRLVAGLFQDARQAQRDGLEEDGITVDFALFNSVETGRVRIDRANHHIFLTITVSKVVNGEEYDYGFRIWLKDASFARG